MISDRDDWRGDRIFRVALIASVIVHIVLGLAAFGIFDRVTQLAHVRAKPKDNEIIAISSATRIEHRPKPVPAARPARPHVVIRQPQQPPPQVAQAPARPVPRAQPPAPAKQRHELARPERVASLQPKRTTQAKTISETPTAPPRTPAPERQVALAQHPPAVTRGAQSRARTPKLSEQQLAAIESDLAKTIEQQRALADPLRAVPRETPAAPKRYKLQMSGMFGSLHHGEGYYYPIRGWKEGGWDYYYVSYDFTYPDGIYERGSVPWPIRFAPNADPFANPNIGALHNTPLPGPPVGYAPPAHMGKALRIFFPNTDFSQDDQSG